MQVILALRVVQRVFAFKGSMTAIKRSTDIAVKTTEDIDGKSFVKEFMVKQNILDLGNMSDRADEYISTVRNTRNNESVTDKAFM
jgi:hypothetical protein